MTLDEQRKRVASGQTYDDLTPELIHAHERAVHLADDHDSSFGAEAAKR